MCLTYCTLLRFDGFTCPSTMSYCLQPDKLVECFQYFLQGLGLGKIVNTNSFATYNPMYWFTVLAHYMIVLTNTIWFHS